MDPLCTISHDLFLLKIRESWQPSSAYMQTRTHARKIARTHARTHARMHTNTHTNWGCQAAWVVCCSQGDSAICCLASQPGPSLPLHHCPGSEGSPLWYNTSPPVVLQLSLALCIQCMWSTYFLMSRRKASFSAHSLSAKFDYCASGFLQ